MFQVNDYLVYKREVCQVKDIKKNYMNGLDYFELTPILDKSLKIDIPTNSNAIRKLVSKDEIEELIGKIPEIKVIEADEKLIEQEYKKRLSSGTHQDLIQIIKTSYLRNQERTKNKKKKAEKDIYYFEEAEKDLYQEIGIVLGLSLEETKEYIMNKVERLG